MHMRRFALLVWVLLCLGGPVHAHHSQAMFDQSKMVVLKGVITKFAWLNPHVQVYFDVAENGKTESWQIETNSALNMARIGWKRDQFKAGDKVTVSFHPMRDGTHFGYLRKIVGPDGKEYSLPGGIPAPPGKDQPQQQPQ